MTETNEDEFERIGARHFPSVLDTDGIVSLAALFQSNARPGRRLSSSALQPVASLLAAPGSIGAIAAKLLGGSAVPVRALLLDKSPTANWRLGWHQDRTIAVRERRIVEGFGSWSIKAGQLHVQPPQEITSRMVTLRVHLDRVDEGNAPLQILPGSHLLGRLDTAAVDKLSKSAIPMICLAEPGDLWAYRTAIVHASAEQTRPGHRRVLQVDYSADELPGGLEWVPLLERAS